MVSDASDPGLRLRYLAALRDNRAGVAEAREPNVASDREEAEALDTAVVVADVESCGAVRPRDLALVKR